MADTSFPIEIPKRALFKAAEVCELVKVQPYVLRSWEAEFPGLGVSKGDGPRAYRRTDVEQVIRIKHLLLVEGLTLAGARRKLGEELPSAASDHPVSDAVAQHARAKLSEVKRGLRSILDLLSGDAVAEEFQLKPPMRSAPPVAKPLARARVAGRSRGKGTAARERSASRRKRSA